MGHSITSPRIRNLASATVRDEAEQGDDQRRLEVERTAGADAEDQQEQHGVDVERVERQDAVLRARTAHHAEGGEDHGDAEQDLRDQQRPGEDCGAHVEDLQQQPFVAVLDQVDPVRFVDQVEHMEQQLVARSNRIRPRRCRACGHDAGEDGQRGRIAQLERHDDEARDAPAAGRGSGSTGRRRRWSARCRPARSPTSRGIRCQRRIRDLGRLQRGGHVRTRRRRSRCPSTRWPGDSAVQQQPHRQQRRGQQRIGQQAAHRRPPSPAGTRGAVRTSSM